MKTIENAFLAIVSPLRFPVSACSRAHARARFLSVVRKTNRVRARARTGVYGSICSCVNAGALLLACPIAFVHNDSVIQATRKIKASQAVNFFNTSAVPVPKTDSLASPPNEVPNPELLLSCIKITAHSKMHKKINRAIVKKYKNVIQIQPSFLR